MGDKTNTIRYGIIGFGRYAERRLVPAFSKSAHSKLVAIHKRNPAAASQKAGEYGIPLPYGDPAELVKNSQVQAVIVCSPTSLHKPHTLFAAEAGKHVMVEKPMALNAAECQEMIDACAKNGVKLMAAYVMRFIDAIGRIREIVQSGKLGKIQFASGHFGLDASLSHRTWLNNPKISGGGPVADLGSHILDLLQFILDKPILATQSFLRPAFDSQQIERNAVVSLEFADDILGSLYVSFDVMRESGLTFYGSQGKLDISNFNQPETTVTINLKQNEITLKEEVHNNYYYAALLDHFSRSLLFNEPISMPGETGLRNQLLIDQIYGTATRD